MPCDSSKLTTNTIISSNITRLSQMSLVDKVISTKVNWVAWKENDKGYTLQLHS